MLCLKKKKLFKELLFFYAIVNTNVQMAEVLENVSDRNKTFRKIITNANAHVSKIIFDVITPVDLAKILGKEIKLKKIWSNVKIEIKKKNPKLEYFS